MPFVKNRIADLLAIGMAAAILFGSLASRAPIQAGEGSDKVLHLLAYGALCFFALLNRKTMRGVGLTIISIIVLGVLIEFLQPITGRQRDVADVVANGLGVLLGAMAILVVHILKRPPKD